MTSLVVDTNVVVSANLNPEGCEALVVALVLNRKVRLFVSQPILDEYERVLLYPRLRFGPQEVGRFLAILRKTARMVSAARAFTASVDEGDNRFGECAEAAAPAFPSQAIDGTSQNGGMRPRWSTHGSCWKRSVLVSCVR